MANKESTMNNLQKMKYMNPASVSQMEISRRCFIKQSVITVAGISTFGLLNCTGNSKKNNVLNVIAYNVLKCTGWPSEKVKESNLIPTLIAQELAKYSPDIINFSESPDESIVKEIAKQLNMNYVWFPSGGNWPGAILTRFKIISSKNVPTISGLRAEDLFTRHWGKATIQLPNRETIIVHSVHLYPHDTPVSRDIRQREISEIIDAIREDRETDRSILVQGDLNHTPEMPEYSQWTNSGLLDTFVEAGKGEGMTIRADIASKRIDYILAQGPIANQIVESRALFEGAFRTNPSDPESIALSDHVPQFAVFRVR